MNKKLFLSIIIINIVFFTNAQVAVEKKEADLELLNLIPVENIYMHTNSTMFLVGEYLYYSIYNLKKQENSLSDLSKVAFVELIDSEGKSVFEQSIQIKNGRGIGDYFIPTDVVSGNYKLIAYTSWMKNNINNPYFSQNIVIINPYQSSQEQILSNDTKDSIPGNIAYSETFNKAEANSKILSLGLNKPRYSSREKVEMNLTNTENSEIYYSISVRKINTVDQPDNINAVGYNELLTKSELETNFSNKDSIFLPDLRGHILKGQIVPTSESRTLDLTNTKVALSIPGKEFFLRIANTDSNGNFYFNIDQSFTSDQAKIQVLDSNLEDYRVHINKNNSIDYDMSSFDDFRIDSSMKSMIEDRSVHNQIENAFYTKKPDTIKTVDMGNLFDGIKTLEYDLDEYTRFKTIKETFIEVLEYARLRRTTNNKYELGVLGYKPYENFDGTPLLIIDGLLVQDPTDFLESYDSRKVDKIKIIRDQYFLGSKSYKGVIIIETFEGDYIENYNPGHVKELKLKSIETPKNYFKQAYNEASEEYEDIPDFRYQLLWEPQKYMNESSEKISFYTSDVTGTFEILIQGFSEDIQPISIRKTFRVE